MNSEQKIVLGRIAAAALMLIGLHFVETAGALRFAAYMVAYLIVGYDVLAESIENIVKGDFLDESFLMTVATVGAVVLAVCKTGDYTEAVAVMLFFQTGELFEDFAVGKSRANIASLMNIRPDYANVEIDGKPERVAPETVRAGDEIVVLSGEKVPLDGVVVSGRSTLNTAALTGESVPREIGVGDEVFSGSVNVGGVLKIKTTKAFGESTASKILDLLEHAAARKAKSEKFISKFARVYTPAVCCGAAVLAVLPPLFSIWAEQPAAWESWLYRALIFLIVSCPCALVVSIPLGFFAGIGGAGKAGILIKGANYLETLAKTKTVVFDKTGTLTRGVFEVRDVHHNRIDKDSLIEYAALAESGSTHPIGKSIQRACGKKADLSRVSDIREIGGGGVVATVDGKTVAAGNDKLMRDLNVDCLPCHCAGTIVHAAIDGKYAGHIVIADVVKPQSEAAIQALKSAGVKKTVMLTGDRIAVARQVGDLLHIDEVHAELLPADKVEQVEKLLKRQPAGEKLAFVGDGINDAPVLARADVGIAMGAIGSDAAIEAADVVLMDDDPLKIAAAIRLSRKCLRIVRENIVFAVGVKAACLISGALGIASMGAAVFADVGVLILAVLNAMRALSVKFAR